MLGHCRAAASTSLCTKALKTHQCQEWVELPQFLIAHTPHKQLLTRSMQLSKGLCNIYQVKGFQRTV
jgi:hypothetical protein